MKNHYQTLGVPENASEQEIKLAYRKLAKRYHPDVNAGAKGAEEQFKEIVEAYSILSDYNLRSNYDAKRQGRNLFYGNPSFYSSESATEKKDPRRKEYSEEDLERARVRHRKRTLSNMLRRKNILKGMIVTFILFMVASAAFESYIEEKRNKEAKELIAKLELEQKKNSKEENSKIENMDSPFDAVFGEGQYENKSPNHLVFYIAFYDAVICAQQNAAPYKTIRNEYIEANNGFVMKEMPGGSYFIKMYTGKNWDPQKKIPDGRKLGGFTKDEAFYKVRLGPFVLHDINKKNSDTNTCDTIIIDPKKINLDPISRAEFFNAGEK